MAKVRIPVIGTVGKTITFDPDATVGATLGVDLFDADGTLLTIEALAAAITQLNITPDDVNEDKFLAAEFCCSTCGFKICSEHIEIYRRRRRLDNSAVHVEDNARGIAKDERQ